MFLEVLAGYLVVRILPVLGFLLLIACLKK